MIEAALLYQALESPLGIVLRTSDVTLALQRLYRARAKSQDPSLAVLTFRRAPGQDDEIWLVKTATQADKSVGPAAQGPGRHAKGGEAT